MAQTWSIEAFAEEIGGGFIGNLIYHSKSQNILLSNDLYQPSIRYPNTKMQEKASSLKQMEVLSS